jgi:hypothetical protein
VHPCSASIKAQEVAICCPIKTPGTTNAICCFENRHTVALFQKLTSHCQACRSRAYHCLQQETKVADKRRQLMCCGLGRGVTARVGGRTFLFLLLLLLLQCLTRWYC